MACVTTKVLIQATLSASELLPTFSPSALAQSLHSLLIVLTHKFTNFETNTTERKKVDYSLYKAIKKGTMILPSGEILVTLNPSTIVHRDDYVPYTYNRLPDKVINKFNKHWRMSGQKAFKESLDPLSKINNEFEKKGLPVIESGLIHLPNHLL